MPEIVLIILLGLVGAIAGLAANNIAALLQPRIGKRPRLLWTTYVSLVFLVILLMWDSEHLPFQRWPIYSVGALVGVQLLIWGILLARKELVDRYSDASQLPENLEASERGKIAAEGYCRDDRHRSEIKVMDSSDAAAGYTVMANVGIAVSVVLLCASLMVCVGMLLASNYAKSHPETLVQAASEDSETRVMLGLMLGADPNGKDANGQTPLGAAVEAYRSVGSKDRLSSSLAHTMGLPTNTPAQQQILDDIVIPLLEHGAGANALTQNGETALMNLETVPDSEAFAKVLIEHEAIVNPKDGATPLQWAALFGNFPLAELLVNDGADVMARDNEGATPAHYWAEGGDFDELNRESYEPEPYPANVEPPSDPANSANPYDDTLNAKTLEQQVEEQSAPRTMEDLLVSRRADLGATDNFGQTPLDYAVRFGHLRKAQYLISLGSSPNRGDNRGRTASHLLALAKWKEAEKALRDDSSIPDGTLIAPDGSTYDPIKLELDKQRIRFAKVLIKAGANPQLKDHHGKTAIDLAIENGHPELADLFRQAALVNRH